MIQLVDRKHLVKYIHQTLPSPGFRKNSGIVSMLLFIFLQLPELYAQTDSVVQLNTITVLPTRQQNFSSGLKLIAIDSTLLQLYKNNNLSELLGDQSSIFMKNYGPGTLSTPSMRGGSSYHTAVLWNGFNIASPTNGNVDFALVKNYFSDDVSILYGGTSSLTGSGAMGGTIMLRNNAAFKKGWSAQLHASAGSYDSYLKKGLLRWSGRRWVSSLRLFHDKAENDYVFFDPETKKKKIQSNNQLEQQGALWENYFLTSDRSKLNVRYWYQSSNRQIPPTIFEDSSDARQKDASHRVTAEYNHTGKKFQTSVRSAFFHEVLDYTEASLLSPSHSISKVFIAEAETKYQITPQQFTNIGLANTYTTARSTGYVGSPEQNRFALFASYKFTSPDNKFSASLNGRQEFVGKTVVPFVYSAGANYNLLPSITLRLQGGKVYRIPSFNDLYWSQGGNLQLKPENGYTGEGGLRIDFLKFAEMHRRESSIFNKLTLTTDVTYFAKNINDWIVWSPSVNFWKPDNIMKVYSRGLETNVEITYRSGRFLAGANVKVSYVRSTNEKSKSTNDASFQRQLIYMPMYAYASNAWFIMNGYMLNINHSYTGYRFTSGDNSKYLLPYTLTNLQLSKQVGAVKKFSLNLYFKVNNIFNERYQVMLSRAMPMRNYQIGLSINFNQKNNS